MAKLGIVVPVLVNFRGLAEMLNSVIVRDEDSWTPYIIPNWEKNYSVSHSWNIGLQQAFEDGCDFAIVCNDDILFSALTLPRLVGMYEAMESEYGLLTPFNYRDCNISAQEVVDGFDPVEIDMGQGVGGTDFSCFIVSPRVYEKVGEFDENFKIAYFEDNDYYYRLKLAGYLPLSDGLIPFYHHGSTTQNFYVDAPACPPPVFIENRNYYMGKWGGMPGEEQFKNPYRNSNLSFDQWRVFD